MSPSSGECGDIRTSSSPLTRDGIEGIEEQLDPLRVVSIRLEDEWSAVYCRRRKVGSRSKAKTKEMGGLLVKQSSDGPTPSSPAGATAP